MIMYIDTLSTHMIRIINQNTILSTLVEQSPTNAVYIRYYLKKRNTKVGVMMNEFKPFILTHTCTLPPPPPHNDCSKNWVLILVGVEVLCLWEEESSQSGFKRWWGWAVSNSKVLWVWIPNVGFILREGMNDLRFSNLFNVLIFQIRGPVVPMNLVDRMLKSSY